MGRLIGSFFVGKVGSSSLLPTCVNGMGVVGVIGVSLNLGDFLTICLAGVSVAVAFNGGTGLFLGDDLMALTNPFLSASVSDPRPDFGNSFGFLSWLLPPIYSWPPAITYLGLSPSSAYPYCKGSSQYFLNFCL